jgi:anthranilate phosphoribosyltransferase
VRLGIAAAGDAAQNGSVLRALLAGTPGPVLLNAAGAIAAFRGLTNDLHADLAAGLATRRRKPSNRGAALLDAGSPCQRTRATPLPQPAEPCTTPHP